MYNNRKPFNRSGGNRQQPRDRYNDNSSYNVDYFAKPKAEGYGPKAYGDERRSSRPARGGFNKFGSFNGSRNRSSSFSGGGRSRRKVSKAIDPQMFIKKAEQVEEQAFVPKHTFNDFDIIEQMKQNIARKGYINPTPIQDAVIEHALLGQDVLGIASTGTGKTAAFCIPLLNRLHKDKTQKALIMAPTRELALQIQDELMGFGRGLQVFNTLCIGGASINNQIYFLRKNPQIVVGTPGRLKDLYERKAIDFNEYQVLILDEMDQMLDMGFIHDIKFVVGLMKQKSQTLLFSATMRSDIESIAHSFLQDPFTVKLNNNSSSKNVDQDIVRVNPSEKTTKLVEMLKEDHLEKVLIFVRTKRGADKLAKTLTEASFRTDAIHGDKTQRSRQIALDKFKKNNVNILIATDVAARGLDIDNVTHVINYDAPEQYEDYIHRIGRTGRAGKKGYAFTFVH